MNAGHAAAQTPAAVPIGTAIVTGGTVVSFTRTTLVIRTSDGEYELFVLDANTTRPVSIPQRATVTVASRKTPADQAPVATLVRVTAMPVSPPAAAAADAAQVPDEPIPASVRNLESDIIRQTNRFRLGVRGGVALDPEVVLIGVQTQLGPFFNQNVWARPNLELGFGEVTTLVALNFEAAYRVPVAAESARWQMFVGAGPALNFSKRAFNVAAGEEDNVDVIDDDDVDGEDVEEENNRFDFSDLDLDVGLSLLIGIQSRTGMFMEMRGTAYSTPHIRFSIGYSF